MRNFKQQNRPSCMIFAKRPIRLIKVKAQSDMPGPRVPQDALSFSKATLIENIPASLDGSSRTLLLSIEDLVIPLEGRRFDNRQAGLRWTDKFTTPSMFVSLRIPHGSSEELRQAKKLFAVTCSPQQAKQRSANLAASVIEVLVEKSESKDDETLSALTPGTLLECSQPLGRGFCSLFDESSLTQCLEESRPILCIAVNAKGVAALKGVMDWEPIQALAGTALVTAYLLLKSPSAAPYLAEWDRWRECGIRVNPLYTQDYHYDDDLSGADKDPNAHILRMLTTAICGGEQGLIGAIGGDPREACVLMAGVPGEVAANITRRLTTAGVNRERILFVDYA